MRVKIDESGAKTIDENGRARYYDWVEMPPPNTKGNNTKDKWINIRCTEQERQDITKLANKHNMSVSKFIFWLTDKQRKEDESAKSNV